MSRVEGEPSMFMSTPYINNQIPSVDGLMPPTAVKNPIGDIETTHRNIFICPFLKIWNPKQRCFVLN